VPAAGAAAEPGQPPPAPGLPVCALNLKEGGKVVIVLASTLKASHTYFHCVVLLGRHVVTFPERGHLIIRVRDSGPETVEIFVPTTTAGWGQANIIVIVKELYQKNLMQVFIFPDCDG
jgi:hypothetical protein